MYDTKKKFRRSSATIVCYVLAALMLIYTCYQIGSTINQINQYYAQYGMNATPMEYFTYTLQAALTPLINTVVFFMLAKILDEVRKNNPANYQSDEDIVEAGIAKKEAKDAKKFEKGEKAAAKAAEKSGEKTAAADKKKEDEPVIADFTAVVEEPKAEPEKASEKKSDAKKPAAKKPAAKKSTAKKTEDDKAEPKKTETKKTAAKKSAPKKKAAPKKAEAEKEAEKTETEKTEAE